MDQQIARRDFLKAAPAAASLIAGGLHLAEAPAPAETPYPEIGAQHYTPLADYPIRAKRFSEVTVSDNLPMSAADKKKYFQTNAEKLFKL